LTVNVQFWSFFKEIAGCDRSSFEVPLGTTVGQLQDLVAERFPKLIGLRGSTLVAVGLEYQPAHHVLSEGDQVSIFPPVQGG